METTYGMYFSHDTDSFNKGQVVKAIMYVTLEDGTSEFYDFADYVDFNGATPNSTFKVESGNFYDVPVYFNGSAIGTVPALIGVKGDTDLNCEPNASDSSMVLAYYAKVQTKVENPMLYQGELDTNGTGDEYIKKLAGYGITGVDIIEELSAFLSDVDEDEFSEANWKTTKADRLIDALDASRILAYYARVQTGQPKDITTWNAVLGR